MSLDSTHATQSRSNDPRPTCWGAPIMPERSTLSPGLSAHAPRVRMPAFTEAHLRSFIFIGAIALFATAAHAQTLVDPNKVAPEYREAAEKNAAPSSCASVNAR
ncbi:hypothetical protein ACVME9_005639 [Bradyrhizobium liaoningense]